MDRSVVRGLGEPGQTPRSPTDPLAVALLDSVVRNGDITLSLKITRAANSRQSIAPDTLANIVVEACRTGRKTHLKKALTRVHGFDPNARAEGGISPLAAAVNAGDVKFVRHLLRLGADPSTCTDMRVPADARDETMQLLHAAKAISRLLPRNEGDARPIRRAAASPLTQALRDYDLKRARSLLQQEATRKKLGTLDALWASAVREGREVIQCAILATVSPKSIEKLAAAARPDAHSVLHRSMRDVSPAMQTYLKQFPYRSLRHDFPKYNNGTVAFADGPGTIVCRHLSSHWLRERMISGAWKDGYAALSSADAIRAGISSRIQNSYVAFMNRSPEAHMLHVDDWGTFLADRLEAMRPLSVDSSESVRRHFYIVTSNHSMALELKIANRPDGEKTYSALLYDPNETNTHKRASCTDLSTARQWTFQSFLLAPGSQRTYLLEKTPLLMAFAVTDDNPGLKEDFGASAPGVDPNRRLAGPMFRPCRETIFHLLRGGFGGELRAQKDKILEHLNGLDPKAAAEVLAARDGRRIPGLYLTCQEGHHDAIEAFGEILMASNVSANDKARILECRRGKNPPGMYVALSLGHADTVAALGHIIGHAGLSPDDMKTLFLARFGQSGAPGMAAAQANGHADAVRAFKESVYYSDLTAGQRDEIWWEMLGA
ncbi:ShET2/EspL2 family type III secretion system effector toxin [Herbaspirillum sp. ST 5-3]|uniref:ShET2/EspL2 family type III secretion system effector toxin n=1 Tax=Oxalobacteraceae TaxID=75682 RepID=UPI0010A4D3E2|nr:ShET2/EspL2 family type III secretion system effector toxin [Herbaspirillum sp. ST 5-3]